MEAFGLIIEDNLDDNKLNEDNFSILGKEELQKYPNYLDSYSLRQVENLLIYDLNMRYFRQLDQDDFNNYLNDFIIKNNFKEIKDLNDVKNVVGIYIMILDEYKQVYIGQTVDIRKRIKLHWDKKIQFHNISQWGAYSSKIAIDSFRTIDTTRIFIYRCEKEKLDELEAKFIDEYKEEYLCNLLSPARIQEKSDDGRLKREFAVGEIDNLVKHAMIMYLFKDRDLCIDVHECSHAHRLAVYLEKLIFEKENLKKYSVDIEYNSFGVNIKKIPIELEQDDDKCIRPDIIVHKRGENKKGSNKIIIEIKKDKFDEYDRKKIKEMCMNKLYKYEYGYCLLLTGQIDRYCPDKDKWIKIYDESKCNNKNNQNYS